MDSAASQLLKEIDLAQGNEPHALETFGDRIRSCLMDPSVPEDTWERLLSVNARLDEITLRRLQAMSPAAAEEYERSCSRFYWYLLGTRIPKGLPASESWQRLQDAFAREHLAGRLEAYATLYAIFGPRPKTPFRGILHDIRRLMAGRKLRKMLA